MNRIILIVGTLLLFICNSAFAHKHHKSSGIGHVVSHSAHVVTHKASQGANAAGHAIEHGTEAIGHYAAGQAVGMCKKAIPFILKQAVGKSCQITAGKFEAECNAELDAETEGMAAPACIAGGAILLQACKKSGSVGVELIKPVTDKACAKI
jgi:hypothetical protein